MPVFVFLLAWTLNDSAEPLVPVSLHETLEIDHYDVTGLTPDELVRSFRQRPDPTIVATTRAGLSTRYAYAYDNRACRLTEVEIHLDIDITYPRWRQADRAPESMRAEWQRFLAAVEVHEDGHVTRFRAAGEALSQRLAGLPPAADCEALTRAFEAESERFERDIEAVQSAYEAETGHGARQGARLSFR